MDDAERLTPSWRLAAAGIGLGWLLSAVVLLVGSLGVVTHRLAPLAFTIALVAGLPVLALLKALGAQVAKDSPKPGERETRLAAISAGMLVLAWATYAYS